MILIFLGAEFIDEKNWKMHCREKLKRKFDWKLLSSRYIAHDDLPKKTYILSESRFWLHAPIGKISRSVTNILVSNEKPRKKFCIQIFPLG
jgi:hypothetical protein